jgi:HK97 family phage major capsid protein
MPEVKLSELLQKRTKLHDEARETVERCTAENRAMTKEEEERHFVLCGTDKDQGGEIFTLDKQINQIRRIQSLERHGDDLRSGMSVEEIIEVRKSSPLAHEDPVNTRDGKHKYSLMKACRDCLMGNGQLTGLEKEVSDELEERSGIRSGVMGFKMPHRDQTLTFRDVEKNKRMNELRAAGKILSFEEIDRARQRRALDSGAGAGAIPTILDKDWIEILRNAIKVMAAGAREITDLKGKFAIPRQNQAATSYWVAESTAPTGSNQTFDQVLFTPHTIGAYTDISRRFFELTILDSGEAFVKEDLTAILARGIDLAALNGTGNAQQPLGILQNTGITSTRTVALGTNGLAPTWAPLVELFTIVSRGNANDLGEFVYMTNADGIGTLATTAKIGSTFPIYLLNVDDMTLYAKRILSTQQLPNNLTKGSTSGSLSPILGGIWNQLILAYWTGVDILVDPFTGSNTGTIRVVALQDMDIQVRHNEAFAVIVDMITNQSQ